jgi:alpha-amylase/alpha-mannosidase (GH57 family)
MACHLSQSDNKKSVLTIVSRSVMRRRSLPLLLAFLLFPLLVIAQPTKSPDGVTFTYKNDGAKAVSVVGDFNGWSTTSHPMSKSAGGEWTVTVDLLPGTYQYAFSIDGSRIEHDPANPLTFESLDGKRLNTLLSLGDDGKLLVQGYPVRRNLDDNYSKTGGTVYLNLVFKHHVPLFYNPSSDQIEAPFVRQHACRDYFELADVIQRYPNVHATAVLSPTLLWQIQEIYVKRLEPFVKPFRPSARTKPAEMDAARFLASMKGKTDPWIDICLTPAERLTEQDKAYLYKNEWNAFTMSPVRLRRFPEMMELYDKWQDANGNPNYTVDELRLLKFFAIFANFDTEFYERRVPLIQTGTRIYRSLDLRDLVSFRSDGKYYLKRAITEEDCARAVASSWYIMASILPAFEKARYNPTAMIGQLEMAATSYSDAVLPLLINSDVAKEADPNITLPAAYQHPGDVDAQLKMAIEAYKRYMNITPTGYVPPYGAISPAVIPLLKDNGFEWFTSDEQVLRRSEPKNLPSTIPYSVTVDGKTVFGAFTNTLLSNRVNWMYRHYYAENSADDFIRTVLSMAPNNEKKDALVTVVIDGDDAWMHYERDIDGKGIINGIYRKLNKLFENRTLVSVTMSEYIHGNRMRGVPAHKAADFEKLNTLAAGSRFEGKLSTWIGSDEMNAAWDALRNTRSALAGATPDVSAAHLDNFKSSAFNFFYGATSPQWFEAFNKQSLLKMNPKPFEQAFLANLSHAGRIAGGAAPSVASFVNPADFSPEWSTPRKRVQVTFLCKLVDREAITSVNIAGSRKELANLEPNTVRMWDNGENGDKQFGDNVWTLITEIDEGELLYKFSNSGGQGTWEGAETFPDDWRRITITGDKMVIEDVFARMKKY